MTPNQRKYMKEQILKFFDITGKNDEWLNEQYLSQGWRIAFRPNTVANRYYRSCIVVLEREVSAPASPAPAPNPLEKKAINKPIGT